MVRRSIKNFHTHAHTHTHINTHTPKYIFTYTNMGAHYIHTYADAYIIIPTATSYKHTKSSGHLSASHKNKITFKQTQNRRWIVDRKNRRHLTRICG